jgi:capsid protein
MKGDYVRGFKEALEWVMYVANGANTLDDLIQKIDAKYQAVLEQHILNINEEFKDITITEKKD